MVPANGARREAAPCYVSWMLAREEARLRALFRKLMQHVAVASVGSIACACAPGTDGEAQGDASAQGATDAGKSDATIASGDGGEPGGPSDACSDHFVVVDAPNDGSNCEYLQRLGCGLPENVRNTDGSTRSGCALYLGICYSWCSAYGSAVAGCSVVECDDGGNLSDPNGPVTIDCINGIPACTGTVGRRPNGLRPAPRCELGASDAVGAWLAQCARLEAASVRAFRDLHRELEALGAPSALVRAAKRSAWDEVRHTRVVARLARARGAKVERAAIAKRGRRREPVTEETRSARVLALALENAVEGCVRETFGAFVAMKQSAEAKDERVRRAMRGIAEDETRHAALAWGIAAWVEGELEESGRADVGEAMRGAIGVLGCEVRGTGLGVAAAIGLPTGADGAAMVKAFAATLDCYDESAGPRP